MGRSQLNININPDLLKSLKIEVFESNKRLVKLVVKILNDYINNSINNETESSKIYSEIKGLKKRISLLEEANKND